MANMVRLVNGGTIQVRTGALQGVGPQGPRGVSGPAGPDGPQGIQGDQGPIGQILEQQALTRMALSAPVVANADTLINFGSVAYDEIGVFGTSNANIVLGKAGGYLISAWVRFDDAPSGSRELWFQTGPSIIARDSRDSFTGAPFYMSLSYPYRALAGEIVNVYVRSASGTQIVAGLGQVTVVRTGSGPIGPEGPEGQQGPRGLQGIQGEKGDDGDANSGFATYSEMVPH
jgi:hypothetical protein